MALAHSAKSASPESSQQLCHQAPECPQNIPSDIPPATPGRLGAHGHCEPRRRSQPTRRSPTTIRPVRLRSAAIVDVIPSRPEATRRCGIARLDRRHGGKAYTNADHRRRLDVAGCQSSSPRGDDSEHDAVIRGKSRCEAEWNGNRGPPEEHRPYAPPASRGLSSRRCGPARANPPRGRAAAGPPAPRRLNNRTVPWVLRCIPAPTPRLHACAACLPRSGTVICDAFAPPRGTHRGPSVIQAIHQARSGRCCGKFATRRHGV